MLMFEKLKSLAARLDELEMRLSEPELYDDPDRAASCSRSATNLSRSSRLSAPTERRSRRSGKRWSCCPIRI